MNKTNIYGFCPLCGSPGVSRERHPNGDDKCSKGHHYPSKNSVNRECLFISEDGSSEHTTISNLKIGDRFSLNDFHPDPIEDGSRIYVARSTPYLKNGIYCIQVDE